jgi:hypothetical protein
MKSKDKNKIGSLIEGPAYRDAVHVAVAPCEAGESLEPGDPVAFTDDGKIVNWKTPKIGIVDPFLTDPVKEGERCWVFLYPGTALNLRHEWDHPAFRSQPAEPDPADKAASKIWLQVYAEQHGMKLDDMLAGVATYVEKGCDDNAVFEDDFKNYEVPDVFWKHYSALTGKTGSGNFWGCCI